MKTQTSVLAVLAFLIASNVSWAGTKTKLVRKAENIVKEVFNSDIKSKVTWIKEGICGGEGPSYIVEVQIRRYRKKLGRNSGIELVPYFETIKTYGISELELATQGAPAMMDSETCLE